MLDVKRFVAQQTPRDARILVGQRNRGHLASSPADEAAEPVGARAFTLIDPT